MLIFINMEEAHKAKRSRSKSSGRLLSSFLLILKILIFIFILISTGKVGFSQEKIKIEYFGRKDCKNCVNLHKFLTGLKEERKDFDFVEYRIDENEENRKFFDEVTTKLKLVKGTPVIYINRNIIQGFDTPETTGKEIIRLINEGKGSEAVLPTLSEYMENGNYGNISSSASVCTGEGECRISGFTQDKSKEVVITIPFINRQLDLTGYSLPLMSLILGAVDGFNPCAMWVLVLFLTALIAVGNKVKMIRVAGLFIFAEGVMYYFILNVWLYTWDFVGLDRWVTPIVGVIAIIGGIFFIRNYLKKGNELTCEVTDLEKRAKISRQIRDIADRPFTFLTALAIIGLALSVNVIEFACSVGIPQTFTKILQINGLSFVQRQLYTLIYILGYMIDDFIVFGLGLLSAGKLQLTTRYSKWVNLLGGILMVILGLILLIKPGLLVL